MAEIQKFSMKGAARAAASKMNVPNSEFGAMINDGAFSPVIYLRSDQAFMAQRILERGIAVAPIELKDQVDVG